MKQKINKAKFEKKKKPVKSMRGVPEMYDEVKQRFSICLTPTAHQQLTHFAQTNNLSLSEFLERIGRKIILLVSEQDLPKSKKR